ncbi:alpha/beta hydrolase [Segetibacter koreensis]|uniref:alpha/beta hydrolase n=1 Tax=Segetibacter koreensis TaxID=398037 RepID=UPI000376BA42|nr:alpha/beta hydrolase [Segetibacter koreensis]
MKLDCCIFSYTELSSPNVSHIFQLPDERDLCYCLYGPGDGQPVLYFHGTPSSRLEPSLPAAYGIDIETLLLQYKVQLIAIDRPGMGLSTFNPSGDFISFAQDVNLLLQHLKIKQCKVMCWSGGGPFALAIADQFKEMIQAVFIITAFTVSFSSDSVFSKMHRNKFYFGAARYIPSVSRILMNLVSRKKPSKPIPQIISKLPAADHQLITNVKTLRHVSATTLQEGCRNGSKGAVYEAQLYFKDYGYHLKDIQQPVHFWWGNEDNVVIRLHAEAVEQQVANHTMHYKQNEGHLSIYFHYIEEVLETISKC